MESKQKLVIIFLLNLFFLAPPVFCQSWEITDSPTHQNLARLDMLSSSIGWAVSYDGLILQYDGQQWSISDSLRNLKANFLPKADSVTIDASDDPGDIYTICMIDSSFGWMAVNNVKNRRFSLIEFKNSRWQPTPHYFPIKFRAIDFTDQQFGIAIGDGGGFQFHDGEWKILRLPVSSDFRAVQILSPNQIFICGRRGMVLQKNKKWTVVESPTSVIIRDLDFISPNEGWLVGNNGTILHYENGHIKEEITPTQSHLWAVDMVSADYGFAVGKDGVILIYNGQNWQHFPSPTIADLHDIEMIGEDNGWIVGAWGTLLKFDPVADSKMQKQRYFLFHDQVHHQSHTLMDRIDDVQGVTFADFNNDGSPDIYLTCYHNLNHLLLNQGKGYYIDYVIESGTGGNVETRMGKSKYEIGSLAADFDRDGDTDLLLAGKQGTTVLFVNNGSAVFRDMTLRSNLPDDLDLQDGALADINEDGYPDLILADEREGLRIFINCKYNRFKEMVLDSVPLPTTRIRAVAVADFNNDRHQDIIAFYHPSIPVVLLNDGNGGLTLETDYFGSQKIASFVNSITIADFNNDAHNDLFLCSETGEDALYLWQQDSGIFVNQAKEWNVRQEGRSYSGVAGDFDLDGDQDLFVSRFGQDFLYRNVQCNHFQECSGSEIYSKVGYLSGYNTGAATADIDDDGDLDLVVGNFEYWSSLLQNATNDSGFISLNIVGTFDTHEALGAKIWVYSAGSKNTLLAYREIIPSNALFSQNWSGGHVGIGNHEQVDVEIVFLNGSKKRLVNVDAGSFIHVRQSSRMMRNVVNIGRKVLQFVHIPQVPRETVKLLLFLALIFISVRFVEKRYQWRPIYIALYVLIVMILYGSLTFFSTRLGGIVYHAMPFAIIFFTVAILISINEQIRKSTMRQTQLQKNIQQASVDLSKINLSEKALSIVVRTLKLIYPYRYFKMYLYFPNGNFFLCKKTDGVSVNNFSRTLTIDFKRVQHLVRVKSPLSHHTFTTIVGELDISDEQSLIFPLVKKNDIQGIAILGLHPAQPDLDPQTTNIVQYLFLQLTVTLANIRISKEMQDQEKLAAIGSFAGSIIHNLKNPVDGLRMIIEILEINIPLTDPRNEYIRELKNGILNLKKILLQTLDITNQSDQSRENLCPNDLVNSVIENLGTNGSLIRPELRINGIEIKGNKSRLIQALENLIQNALEASNYQKPVIVRTATEANEYVHIDIIDQGAGIAEKEFENIFTIFYSTHESGRGLGLPITQGIIKNHNGYITVESEKGKGSRFTVVLPIAYNRG